MRFRILSVLILLLLHANVFSQSPAINLLADARTTLVRDQSETGMPLNEKLLRDFDDSTIVNLMVKTAAPVQLVYHFGGETVVPLELNVKTAKLAKDQAQVEILVSDLSATAGYQSLRIEPLRASDQSDTRLRLEPVAAKWIMIKFVPFENDVTVAVAELELNGTVGPPKSVYKFDESPADAIQVISKLRDTVDVPTTPDEVSLFKDAADGSLDKWSFAEAALISSGITNEQDRKRLLDQIDRLETDLKHQISDSLPAFERGQKLLELMHQTALSGGYQKQQTNLSKVLETGTFNCVSSATLYNILAKRIGLDARGIEVPDHAFSIVYDGTSHADVETTTQRGFNPARNKAAVGEIRRQTGFVYIPDRQRSKRREIDDTGMIALTYYNHGVRCSEAKNFDGAMINYFKALSLDSKNKSAIKNVLAAIANWSGTLAEDGKLEQALAVLTIGLELAPKDRTINHNHKFVWQQMAKRALDKDDIQEALGVFATAYERTNDEAFLELQSTVYLIQGDKKVKAKDWNSALEIGEAGLAQVDESAKRKLERWIVSVVLRWSNSELKSKNFAKAIDILERGTQLVQKDYRLDQNIGYVAQEWGKHAKEFESEEAGRAVIEKMSKRFPNNLNVQKANSGYTSREAKRLIESGDFEAALKLVAAARLSRPDDYRLKQLEESTWIRWTSPLIDDREWEQAVDIYRKALDAHPGTNKFNQNLTYIVQEWSRDIAKRDGIQAAEELVNKYIDEFPKVYQLKKLSGIHLYTSIRKLMDEKEFEKAEMELVKNSKLASNKHEFNQFAVRVYYQHAKEDLENKRWENAIAIFEKGFKNHPDARGMKDNLAFSWGSWAKELMDEKEWQAAIDIYDKGLESLPNNRTFKNNIKYCRSKLEKDE